MKTKLIMLLNLIAIIINAHAQQLPIAFDVAKVPFSYKGSYMVLGVSEDVAGDPKLYLRDVSGNKMWQNNNVFLLEPFKNGKIEKASIKANSAKVELISASGKIEFCYQDANTIRLKGTGIGLKMTQIAKDQSNLVMPIKAGQWRVQQGGNAHYVFSTLVGTANQSGERYTLNEDGANKQVQGEVFITLQPDKKGSFEVALEQYPYGWSPKEYPQSFDECVKNANQSLLEWVKKTPQVNQNYQEANLMASYLNWSCVVSKRGFITREMTYTSKNTMRAAWSWDHCFTAMALAYKDPDQAWDNFMLMFDHQNETGSFPDFINDRQALWGFVKPPIHGWTYRKMMQANPKFSDKKHLTMVYLPLVKWTNFWFKYHDDDRDNIPEYHHGNDAGWDNASNFDYGFHAESPDLSAYLALQMDVLAEIAQKLGKHIEAKEWKRKSDRQIKLMIKNLWNGKRFVTKRMDDNSVYEKSQSLMSYLPLILGKKLPKNITDIMIKDLKTNGQFTKIGLASENPNSPLYNADSYWRGPVWAPPTLIIASGVNDYGDKDFAREIAKRYCDNCKINGFAENYDALSGVGLRDYSLTWSSSVFQILAHEYLLTK